MPTSLAKPADLLDNNRRWAADREAEEPGFFARLTRQQTPAYLWIGCSDSRVPANEIVGLPPGEVFVHRNIANVVVHSDLNALSVVQYAVDALRVRHVIVTGHYGCGGVRAALSGARIGLVDNWLRHVQDVARTHRGLLEDLAPDKRADRLAELNVLAQVENLCRTTILQEAWARGQAVAVHGWIYGLHDGRLRDLGSTVSAAEQLPGRINQAITSLTMPG
jgi:carbonic anhydrase